MSCLRSILLHVDASARSVKRTALARALAEQHDAAVTALYASTPTTLSFPLVAAQSAAEMLPMLQQLDIDYRDNAKALFDRSNAAAARPFMWRELSGEPIIPGFARHALLADLLVLGQHDPSDPTTVGVPADFVESVLLASGRPALIVPYVDTGPAFGQDVLIAWKSTRESAHAVSAAIAFLRKAQCVHLVVEDGEPELVEESTTAVEAFLRAHGVQTPIRRHGAPRTAAAGDGLLSLAADVGADLLVMGCYGHSRARELVLGGASRTVLHSMTLPVLMAH